eukprot:623928_1
MRLTIPVAAISLSKSDDFTGSADVNPIVMVKRRNKKTSKRTGRWSRNTMRAHQDSTEVAESPRKFLQKFSGIGILILSVFIAVGLAMFIHSRSQSSLDEETPPAVQPTPRPATPVTTQPPDEFPPASFVATGISQPTELRILGSFPHDRASFVQGLEIENNTLWESNGGYGESNIRQLTWRRKTGFIFDRELNEIGTFSYAIDGWGIVHDDTHLI